MEKYLAAGHHLHAGDEVISTSGRYRLRFQPDGNLVLYDGAGDPIWNTNTWDLPIHERPICARMQHDGNFVLYTCENKAVWNSGTDGHGGAYLAVQDDRNIVIYTADGREPVWATGTMHERATPLQITSILTRSRPLLKDLVINVLANLIASAALQ